MNPLAGRWRNRWISVFVVFWLILFHYETFRLFYLSSWLDRPLPKTPLLFPPAGWIMFYQIDNGYGHAEVYGVKGTQTAIIPPHEIFETDAVGYDNIRRNVLIGVLYEERAARFCHFLKRKFPKYSAFVVAYAQYPDVIEQPGKVHRKVMYRCN